MPTTTDEKNTAATILEISAADVVYFDPFTERRLDDLEVLARYYENIRGKVQIDRYKLINPKVQLHGDAAVLTFNLHRSLSVRRRQLAHHPNSLVYHRCL